MQWQLSVICLSISYDSYSGYKKAVKKAVKWTWLIGASSIENCRCEQTCKCPSQDYSNNLANLAYRSLCRVQALTLQGVIKPLYLSFTVMLSSQRYKTDPGNFQQFAILYLLEQENLWVLPVVWWGPLWCTWDCPRQWLYSIDHSVALAWLSEY